MVKTFDDRQEEFNSFPISNICKLINYRNYRNVIVLSFENNELHKTRWDRLRTGCELNASNSINKLSFNDYPLLSTKV